jgi:hypothetical protein
MFSAAWLVISIAATGVVSLGSHRGEKPLVGEFAGLPHLSTTFEKLKASPVGSSLYPYGSYHGDYRLDEGLFTPSVESLNALGSEKFVSLSHPAYPQYNVRIKKSDFCDGGVRSYTGYIDIEAKHLFFYFVRSFRLILFQLLTYHAIELSLRAETVLKQMMLSFGPMVGQVARPLSGSLWSLAPAV